MTQVRFKVNMCFACFASHPLGLLPCFPASSEAGKQEAHSRSSHRSRYWSTWSCAEGSFS